MIRFRRAITQSPVLGDCPTKMRSNKLTGQINSSEINKTYMDAPVMSTHYLSLRADFQHELRS